MQERFGSVRRSVLIDREQILAREQAEVRSLGEDQPQPALGAKAAIAAHGAGRQVNIALETDRAAMAAAFVRSFHSWFLRNARQANRLASR
jgi:hypothetical protein